MKNIFIENNIVNYYEEYGKLINLSDIHINIYEDEKTLNLFSKYNLENKPYKIIKKDNIENISDSGKYFYMTSIYITTNELKDFVDIDNIDNTFYDNEIDAYEYSIKFIKESIKRCFNIDIYDDNTIIYKYSKYLKYEFKIFKILKDRIIFNSDKEKDEYYHKNKDKISLKELLTVLIGGVQINNYDINGNLISVDTLTDGYKKFCFKSLLGYHVNKFNIGDKVKVIHDYYNIKNATIVDVLRYNKTIYESDDPYHFKEGYYITWSDDDIIYNTENWEDLFYDEDLELL